MLFICYRIKKNRIKKQVLRRRLLHVICRQLTTRTDLNIYIFLIRFIILLPIESGTEKLEAINNIYSFSDFDNVFKFNEITGRMV